MQEKIGLVVGTVLLGDVQVVEYIGLQQDIQVLEQEDNRMLELNILGPAMGNL